MKRKTKKDKSIILRLFVLGVCGYFLVTLIGLLGDLSDKQKELSTLKEEIKIVENDIEAYRTILDSDSDQAIFEKFIRERFGYIYPDEQIFVGY